jgi:hypothetical protein
MLGNEFLLLASAVKKNASGYKLQASGFISLHILHPKKIPGRSGREKAQRTRRVNIESII